MPTGMISEGIDWGNLNPLGLVFNKFPLTGLKMDIEVGNWKGNPNVPSVIQVPAMPGQITVNLATGDITGVATNFGFAGNPTGSPSLNDFIWFNDGGNLESQVIVKITEVIDVGVAKCDINTLTLPDGNPITYTYNNRIYFLVDATKTLTDTIFLDASSDTTSSGAAQAVAGNRLYYSDFQAYNWNTGVVENIAQTYATSIGAELKDLGWESGATWITAIGTLLSYAGWNDTLTTVVPDTTLIDNSNQEIVVYFVPNAFNFLGTSVGVLDDMIFYEQSNVVQDYKTQLGVEPFGKQTVKFNLGDGYGIWYDPTQNTPPPPIGNTGDFPNPFTTPYNINPNANDMVASSNVSAAYAGKFGQDDIFIGEYNTTYNQTATGLILTNQDFQPNQFQVYFQYTVYDGLEAIAAEELTKQGIQVSPENVDWYRKNIERLAEVEAIDWEFDEENPPERDEPKEYNPEEDNDPRDYVPRNAKEVNSDGN